ncbi:MAG: PKD domain-containing protein [Saprospiraceae bacterium]
MQRIILLFVLIGISFYIGAQSNVDILLNQKFTKYDIIKVNAEEVYTSLLDQKSSRTNEYTLQLNETIRWQLNLTQSNIIAEDYTLTTANSDGITSIKVKPSCIPMHGYVVGNPSSKVSLTFDRNFIYGFIEVGNVAYYIEPLSYYISAAEKDAFILYSTNDIIEDNSLKCGYELQKEKLESHRQEKNHQSNNGSRTGLCYFLKYALAADYSMVQQYGSVSAVQNHNIGVVNNVQTNYDNDFADEFTFQISEQWISNCSTCDPWTSSTDSGALLDDFTAWAVIGFTTSHDIGACWSYRNFDGGTIGLAWVGTVCTQFRYHVLQDFSTNANLKRVMNAHEIGHNFDASHNTGIMAPSVSNSNTWSGTSINEIENFYMSLSCLDNCTSSNPPQAEFSYTIVNTCVPATVTFTNLSVNASSYLWEFEGGTPATSTDFEPTVQWDESGTYNVTLTSSEGPNSHSITLPITLDVIQNPVADFTYSIIGNSVTFTFIGSDAFTFSWNFGDGSVPSTEPNPTHTYASNGTYTVTLTVTNPCETSTISYDVLVQFSPSASFSATPVTGCTPMVVSYANTSTNATSFEWQFPGGSPSTSTEANPIIVYNTPGIYDVVLTAFNDFTSHIEEKMDFITVDPAPTSQFNFTVNGLTAAFTNNSQYGTSTLWDFGDGSTSMETSPTHTYANNGVYTVQLSTSNDCGTVTSTQTVALGIAPVAGISTLSTTTCTETSVQFNSTSENQPTSYAWTFEGGNPSTSSEQNPVVSYSNSGTFDVSLTVTNAFGTNTLTLNDYISVNSTPNVNFDFVRNDLNVVFTSQIQNGTIVNWDFGDGFTSTETNPTHTYAAQGTYDVTLTAQNSCGNDVYTESVLVQLLPTASFQASTTTGCIPTDIQFTSIVSPSVTAWLWTFEGGNPTTSTLPNPTVTYNNTGTFDVSLVVTNSTGSITVVQNDVIVINTQPSAGFNESIAGNVLNLSNTGIGANNTTYSIQGPNGFNTSVSSPLANITLPQNGTYSVVQTNMNSCGTATSTSEITLDVYTIAGFTLPTNAICEGSSIIMSNQSTNANSYAWTADGANPTTSSEQNPQFTYSQGGNYMIRLITSNALGMDTSELQVTIGYLPESSFSFSASGATVNFTNDSQYDSNVSWDFDDGTTSTETNPTHTFNSSGIYQVKLIAYNGCGIDTSKQNISIQIVGTDDVQDKFSAIALYPNPVTENVNVNCSLLPDGDYIFLLKDVLGGIVEKQYYNITGNNKVINMSCKDINTNGTYLLQIVGKNINIVNPLIISK